MGQEVLFSCAEHKASFAKLTPRQKEYIIAYMETGSPTEVARRLGLRGQVKGVSKKITQIAKLMGAQGARQLNPNRTIIAPSATAVELKKKAESQCYRCALSGRKLTPESAQLDHKIPVCDGGDHSIENLQVVHIAINRMKAAMCNGEFIKLCKLVAKWNG